MTPEEIVEKLDRKGVKLRINPTDGKLTATPIRKVSAELRNEMRAQRAQLIEFVEERDGGGEEWTVEDLPPADPPKPSIAETIIATAAAVGITIALDFPGPQGLIRVTTPWVRRLVPDPNDPKGETMPWIEAPTMELGEMISASIMPSQDYCSQQREQIPTALAAQIQNFRPELLQYLRAPYLPDPGPEPVDNPRKRSIWERMARPDSMIPGARDNQARIKRLLFGDTRVAEDKRASERRNQLDMALPTIVAAQTARRGGTK